jgi:hypothetical protein
MKAYLVQFEMTTRVVAENEEQARDFAVAKLINDRELLNEKIEEDTPNVYEDYECPATDEEIINVKLQNNF